VRRTIEINLAITGKVFFLPLIIKVALNVRMSPVSRKTLRVFFEMMRLSCPLWAAAPSAELLWKLRRLLKKLIYLYRPFKKDAGREARSLGTAGVLSIR
jgi:hypothetical protein